MAVRRVRPTGTSAAKPAASRYRDEDKDYEEQDTAKDYDDRSTARRRPARDEEERPARSVGRSRREEPEEERPRRGRRDEDEAPRGRRRSGDEDEEPQTARRPPVKGGWDASDKAQAAAGDWATETKLDSKESIFKFLDDAPFVVFGQHWINENKGKKSFVCLNDITNPASRSECPLCDMGDKPRVFSCFNVLRMGEKDEPPRLEVLKAAVRLKTALKDKGEGKDGPLTHPYWSLNSSGKGTSTTYNIAAVKERDLESDWDIYPLTDEELEDFERDAYTSDNFPEGISSKRDLMEVAEAIS